MGIVAGEYRYMEDLLGLKAHRAHQTIVSFRREPTIVVSALLTFMQQHSDQRFASYIWNGLCKEFHIRFDRQCRLRENWRNCLSSLEHPSVVQQHIQVELKRGSLVGPPPPGQAEQIQVSPLGLVPKPHSDKWCLIVDLSVPTGASVNDGISEDLCSLPHASVDDAVSIIQYLGLGTQAHQNGS